MNDSKLLLSKYSTKTTGSCFYLGVYRYFVEVVTLSLTTLHNFCDKSELCSLHNSLQKLCKLLRLSKQRVTCTRYTVCLIGTTMGYQGLVLCLPVRLGASTNTPFSPQLVSLVLYMSDRDPDPNRVMALTP